MRKTLWLLVGLCLLLLAPLATRTTASAEEAMTPVVRIGYVLPGINVDTLLAHRQIYAQYFDEVTKYTHWTYELVPLSVEGCRAALQNGTVQLLVPVEVNPDPAATSFCYSQFDTSGDIIGLFQAPGSTRFDASDLRTLDGARIGLLTDRADATRPLQAFQQANGLHFTYHYFKEQSDMVAALAQGDIDLTLDASTNVLASEEAFLLAFDSVPTRVAGLKTDTRSQRLLHELDQATAQLIADDPRFLYELRGDFYTNNIALLTHFSPDETTYLQSIRSLRCVIYGQIPPLVNAPTQTMAGIMPDFLAAAAAQAGLELTFTRVETYQQAADLLARGEADIMLDIYNENMKDNGFYYTSPLTFEPLTLVTRRGESIKDGGALLVPMNFPSLIDYITTEFPRWHVAIAPSLDDSLSAVEQGHADALLLHSFFIQRGRLFTNHPDLVPLTDTTLRMPVCIAISPHRTQRLQTILNKAILRLPTDARSQIIGRYAAQPEPFSLIRVQEEYPLEFGLGLGAMLLLLAGLGFSLYHSHTMDLQRRHLADANADLSHLLADLRDAGTVMEVYKERSETDLLTGCLNKSAMERHYRAALQMPTAPGHCHALFMLDLDHFKDANDTLGHAFGDKVLQDFARGLKEIVHGNELVARFGGDEFQLLLLDRPPAYLLYTAERILGLAHRLSDPQLTAMLSASIGIARTPQDGTSYDKLFKHADFALYQVKDSGRNGFRFYEPLH